MLENMLLRARNNNKHNEHTNNENNEDTNNEDSEGTAKHEYNEFPAANTVSMNFMLEIYSRHLKQLSIHARGSNSNSNRIDGTLSSAASINLAMTRGKEIVSKCDTILRKCRRVGILPDNFTLQVSIRKPWPSFVMLYL